MLWFHLPLPRCLLRMCSVYILTGRVWTYYVTAWPHFVWSDRMQAKLSASRLSKRYSASLTCTLDPLDPIRHVSPWIVLRRSVARHVLTMWLPDSVWRIWCLSCGDAPLLAARHGAMRRTHDMQVVWSGISKFEITKWQTERDASTTETCYCRARIKFTHCMNFVSLFLGQFFGDVIESDSEGGFWCFWFVIRLVFAAFLCLALAHLEFLASFIAVAVGPWQEWLHTEYSTSR